MTIIGFVRHGVTDWNEQMRIQGHSDIPLNETGRKQAEAIAKRLKREDWDLIVSSDLSRAHETAKTIAKALNLEIEVTPQLREMYCGQAEGTIEAERIERWGKNWRELDLGFEKDEAIADRGVSCVEELIRKYPGKRILIVSHGGLIGRTLKRLIPHVDTKEHLQNTSLTVLKFHDDRWDCELYNCIEHLKSGDFLSGA